MQPTARPVKATLKPDWLVAARGFGSPYLDRIRAPSETLALMRPRLWEFGVTRLARLTGLDHIGIPVWSAIRPNSKTLSVSQGKGLDDAAAAASAMMEAIEVATAERADLPRVRRSAEEMAAERRDVIVCDDLLRADATTPDRAAIINWIEGYDLLREAAVWVPLDVVALSEDPQHSPYWQSTDGLASGNIPWEAVFHGLCERIERDALALWALGDDSGSPNDVAIRRSTTMRKSPGSPRRSPTRVCNCVYSTFRATSAFPYFSRRSRLFQAAMKRDGTISIYRAAAGAIRGGRALCCAR